MQLLGVTASHGAGARSGGDFESIATYTIGAGGATDITFSSIPQTYTHLQLRTFTRNTVQLANLRLQFNSDTGANYSHHQLYGNGSIAGGDNIVNYNHIYIGNYPTNSNIFATNITDILDYTNTYKYKTTRTLHGYDLNGSGWIQLISNNWRSTSAITSIKIFTNTDSFAQYSHFALYGIKA